MEEDLHGRMIDNLLPVFYFTVLLTLNDALTFMYNEDLVPETDHLSGTFQFLVFCIIEDIQAMMISLSFAAVLVLFCIIRTTIICNLVMISIGLVVPTLISSLDISFAAALFLSVLGSIAIIYNFSVKEQVGVHCTIKYYETQQNDIWVFLENYEIHGNGTLSNEAVVTEQTPVVPLDMGMTSDKDFSVSCRRFKLAEIQLATRNFDDALVIGRGGFGKVYKGSISSREVNVAIKRLGPLSKQGQNEFWTEIRMLSKFRHCHLTTLIGYCDDSDEMILVYEYMIRGSLADHLHTKVGGNVDKSPKLCWVQRLKICIGVARGLDYLHTGTGFLDRVIHRDVKPSNILLDENWVAKISDFGLSKEGPANQSSNHVTTFVKGTRGYLDPDYVLTHRLTQKSDVYAFGVMLFEMLSGRHPSDEKRPKEQRNLAAWAQSCIRDDKAHYLIDPNLEWEIFSDSLKEFVIIANRCLHSRPKKRPNMCEVVVSLESSLALQERKDSSLLDMNYDLAGTFDDQ